MILTLYKLGRSTYAVCPTSRHVPLLPTRSPFWRSPDVMAVRQTSCAMLCASSAGRGPGFRQFPISRR